MNRITLLLFFLLMPLLAIAQPSQRFTSITVESNGIMKEITSTPNPSATYQKWFFKSDGMYYQNSAGAVTGPLAAAGAATSTNVPWGNTIYVDAVNGNDSTAVIGNAAKPYLTVSNAWRAIVNNSRLIIRPGFYNQNRLGSRAYGTGGEPLLVINKTNVVIEGYGATITNGAAGITGPLMCFSNCVNFKLLGLKIKDNGVIGTNGVVYGEIVLAGVNRDVEIAYCTLEDVGNNGIIRGDNNKHFLTNAWYHHNAFIRGGDTNHEAFGPGVDGTAIACFGENVTASDNYIKSWSRAFEIEGTDATFYRRINIQNNIFEDFIGDYAIMIWSGTPMSEINVMGNNIFSTTASINSSLDGSAVMIKKGTRINVVGNTFRGMFRGVHADEVGTDIDHCVVSDNIIQVGSVASAVGIAFDDYQSGAGKIYDNLIQNNIVDGPVFNWGIAVSGDNNTVQGNLVKNSGAGVVGGAIYLRKFTGSTTTNNIIRNNTIMDDQASSTTDYGVDIDAGCSGNVIFQNKYSRMLVSNVNDNGTGTQNIWFNPVAPSAGQAMVFRNNTWSNETVSGSGDVTAAVAFGTDESVIRADGTGKGVQASNLKINDSGDLFFVAANTNLTTTISNRVINYGWETTYGRGTNGGGLVVSNDLTIASASGARSLLTWNNTTSGSFEISPLTAAGQTNTFSPDFVAPAAGQLIGIQSVSNAGGTNNMRGTNIGVTDGWGVQMSTGSGSLKATSTNAITLMATNATTFQTDFTGGTPFVQTADFMRTNVTLQITNPIVGRSITFRFQGDGNAVDRTVTVSTNGMTGNWPISWALNSPTNGATAYTVTNNAASELCLTVFSNKISAIHQPFR